MHSRWFAQPPYLFSLPSIPTRPIGSRRSVRAPVSMPISYRLSSKASTRATAPTVLPECCAICVIKVIAVVKRIARLMSLKTTQSAWEMQDAPITCQSQLSRVRSLQSAQIFFAQPRLYQTPYQQLSGTRALSSSIPSRMTAAKLWNECLGRRHDPNLAIILLW